MRTLGTQLGITTGLCTLWYGLWWLLIGLGLPAERFIGVDGRLQKTIAWTLRTSQSTDLASITVTSQKQSDPTNAGHADENLHLTLPPFLHVVPGTELSLYYHNVVLAPDSEKYRFIVTCECRFTHSERRRWVARPSDKDVGNYTLTIRIIDWNGHELAVAKSTLIVPPSDSGKSRTVRLLLVGDSITHQNLYPNELARLLSDPDNPRWSMIGTHHPHGNPPLRGEPLPGVYHEGYGGWTWKRFLTHYQPEEAASYHRAQSPFVFKPAGGAAQLNVPWYLRDVAGGIPPDAAIFLLGINDTWSADPDKPRGLDRAIDMALDDAETLLRAIHSASPGTKFGLCLPPPFTTSAQTFLHVYGKQWPMWRQRRIQHRLIQKMIERFSNREREGIHLIPTYLSLDPVDGYLIDNAGHPNEYGSRQLAVAVYGWLKVLLDEEARTEINQAAQNGARGETPEAKAEGLTRRQIRRVSQIVSDLTIGVESRQQRIGFYVKP